uniref:Uncharacterized protein n=1 Tax=Anopheles farauti TaxID=69004 RepID=A0A182QRC9_9DIPT
MNKPFHWPNSGQSAPFVDTTALAVGGTAAFVESISTSVAIGGTIGSGPVSELSFSRVTLEVDSRRLLLALLLCDEGAECDDDLRLPACSLPSWREGLWDDDFRLDDDDELE